MISCGRQRDVSEQPRQGFSKIKVDSSVLSGQMSESVLNGASVGTGHVYLVEVGGKLCCGGV